MQGSYISEIHGSCLCIQLRNWVYFTSFKWHFVNELVRFKVFGCYKKQFKSNVWNFLVFGLPISHFEMKRFPKVSIESEVTQVTVNCALMYITSNLFLWCVCPELFWFKMHKVAVVETN